MKFSFILVISLMMVLVWGDALAETGRFNLIAPPTSPAKQITCNQDLSDEKITSTYAACFHMIENTTLVCQSPDYSHAFSKELNKAFTDLNYESPGIDVSMSLVTIPQGNGKYKRYNFYTDKRTGQFLYFEELDISEKNGIEQSRLYLNPEMVPDLEMQHKFAEVLGGKWEGNENPKQAYDQALQTFSQLNIKTPKGNSVKLEQCDFFASALDAEANPLALSINPANFNGPNGESNPKGLESSERPGLSIAEKESAYGECMSARFVKSGEMQRISCNLGLPREIVMTIDQAQELTQPGILHLMVGEALQSFIVGHAAMNGKTFNKKELQKIIDSNPACGAYKSIFDSVADDKESLAMFEKEYKERFKIGSPYLQQIRKQATIREGSLKDVDVSELTLAELLKSYKECESAKQLENTRQRTYDPIDTRGFERPTDSEASLFANNRCDQMKEMEKQVQIREGMFPILASDYDAESNDTIWASPYDFKKGREYLKELGAIREGDDKALLEFSKRRLTNLKSKTEELIADTCSGADMECKDQTKLCWHTLLDMKELSKHVAKSTSPSLDPMFECLELVREVDENKTNFASMGAGLACGAVGVAGGIASGATAGVAIPVALTAASVVCGLGVYELMDRPMQSLALTDLELSRACFEVSTYCSQEQVEKSVNDAWWAIFGTKASLVGEVAGLAGEFSGIYKFLKNMPMGDRELFIAYLKGSGKGKTQLEAASAARELLEKLVREGGAGESVRALYMGEAFLKGLDPSAFVVLKDPEKIKYLRSLLGPELTDDALKLLSDQLSSIKDLASVKSLMRLARESSNPEDLVAFVRSAPTDESYTEQVAMLYLMSQGKESGVEFKALDNLIHDPELMQRLERGASGLGCS